MTAILNSGILNLAILDSANLVFFLKLTYTCQDWFPPFDHKKTSLIQSDSNWWWQPPIILPCYIQKLPSWIHTPCYLLWDSLKNTLTPLWLWLKLIQSDDDDVSHLEFCHLGFSHFAQKKLHSFILTHLDDVSHLEFYHLGFRHCHVGFRHLVIFSQIHSQTLSLHSDSDWKLIQSDDGSHLEFCHLWIQPLCTKLWLKLIHSQSTWWCQPSWILPSWIQLKNFTHSFWTAI